MNTETFLDNYLRKINTFNGGKKTQFLTTAAFQLSPLYIADWSAERCNDALQRFAREILLHGLTKLITTCVAFRPSLEHPVGTEMAFAAVLLTLGACREGWTQLGSRCVHATAPTSAESECAAKCASVVRRPWVANDTGPVAVPMCIKSQDEYDFLHTWIVNQAEAQNRKGVAGVYWTGFRRQGTSDGVTPPADWRTAMVHPQGSACSAGTNPWFDSLMSHEGARPILEHRAVHSQTLISRVQSLFEPNTANRPR